MRRTQTKKYRGIRIGLLRRGHTLLSWANSRGYKQSTVYAAARGERGGTVAFKIKQELEEFINE